MEYRERQCLIITGPIDTGKTTRARRMVEELRAQGIRVGGVLTEAVYRASRKRGYRVVDLTGGGQRLLMDETRDLGGGRVGRFSFSAEAFAWAEERLREARNGDAQVICLDEAGPLELRGGGYARVLEELFESFRGMLLLAARDTVIDDLAHWAESRGWRTELIRPSRSSGIRRE